MLETVEDIIEMSTRTGLYLVPCLSNILDFADFARDTINHVRTATRNIFHCCEFFLCVSADDKPGFV